MDNSRILLYTITNNIENESMQKDIIDYAHTGPSVSEVFCIQILIDIETSGEFCNMFHS